MDAVTRDLNDYLASLDESERIDLFIEERADKYLFKGETEERALELAQRDYQNIKCKTCFDFGCPACDASYYDQEVT